MTQASSPTESPHPPIHYSQPDDPDEQSSLLSARSAQTNPYVDPMSRAPTPHGDKPTRYFKTVALCAALNLVADLGGNMTAGPEVRLLEMAVCREFYWRHSPSVIGPPPFAFIDESLCKNQDIQSKLAQLRTVQKSLSVLPGLLLTVFSGSLADVYGRKPLILLSFTGVVFSYLWPLLVCELL